MSTKYEPGVRVSEYLLENCLGVGTFGEVWQARHHIWERERVAIKLPTEPEYVRYLQREGVMVHGLRHANIVRVIGLDPFAEIPYLVMELVRGPSLRDVLREHPSGIAVPAAVTVLRGMLGGVAAAHAANVLHRDIKPGNVLLNLDGRPLSAVAPDDVKLSDFGLGLRDESALRTLAQSASLARDDALVGTLAYMAPEVRDGGGRKPDPRSDLYSVGVVFFEMLTGDRPAGAELPGTIRADVPAALDEIFRRLYARHDRRYGSAAEVAADLERASSAAARPGLVPAVPARVPPPLPEHARLPRCPGCRSRVRPGEQFCTQCGMQVARQVRRCTDCGAYPSPEDRYCILCGTELPGARG